MTAVASPGLTVTARPRRFVGPSIRDPRLHTAAVLVTIQVLGQTVLGFDLSIAQILLSIGTCAALEVWITARRTGTIAWPASAMLTGNGVALILRVPGTVHGDWWSVRGGWIYVVTAAVSLLSKYLIRPGGRHVFNPSNLGLLVTFLLLGSSRVEPLDFWWGPWSWPTGAAVAIIGVGGLAILCRLRLLHIAAAFWVTFAAALAIVTVAGHCITARWHVGPLCGFEFWRVIVTSPELLIFLTFMITDPKTIPATGRRAQLVYAVAIALLAAVAIAPQGTEFGAKVALLAALCVVCAARPVTERIRASRADGAPSRRARAAIAITAVVTISALVVAGLPARPETVAALPRVAFPAVAPGALPPYRVVDDRLSVQVTSDARQIVHDMVQDFAVQARLLRTRALDDLPAIAARSWQAELERRMRAAARVHRVDVERDEIERVVISVAMRPGQAAPAVLVTLFGLRRTVTYVDGRDDPYRVGAAQPLRATYEMLWDQRSRFLVASATPPPGWHAPR